MPRPIYTTDSFGLRLLAALACRPIVNDASAGPPHDYADQLREAVLEAEANVEEYDTDGTRAYAMGLRVAAGMFGLPEGLDPVTRRRLAAGELPADAFLPAHLRDDAPHQQCGGCGRQTWDVSEFGKTCGMAVFGGPPCKGTFTAPPTGAV